MLLVHWLADFALQTDKQATLKSTNITQLTFHVLTYSMVWFMAIWVYAGNIEGALKFSLTTFCFHWITDFITSRIGKPYWDSKDYHNGFTIVGFDQILHYLQLYYTFKYFFPHLLQ